AAERRRHAGERAELNGRIRLRGKTIGRRRRNGNWRRVDRRVDVARAGPDAHVGADALAESQGPGHATAEDTRERLAAAAKVDQQRVGLIDRNRAAGDELIVAAN